MGHSGEEDQLTPMPIAALQHTGVIMQRVACAVRSFVRIDQGGIVTFGAVWETQEEADISSSEVGGW